MGHYKMSLYMGKSKKYNPWKKTKEVRTMDVIVERGCGLDVHKETVVACIDGGGIKKEIRTYSTFTNELLKLKEWLKGNGITHVAMESTGIYWKPVYNSLKRTLKWY